MIIRRVVAAGLVALGVLGPAACTGSGAPAPRPAPTTRTSSPVATRWWSNGAARAGSAIDAKHVHDVAARLHPSRSDYCGMLRQTVGAGRTVLSGATGKDPAAVVSTEAFLAELQAVAPAALAGPWRVVGDAVLTLVGARGAGSTPPDVDAAGVRAAVSTVTADAQRTCGVELSPATIRH